MYLYNSNHLQYPPHLCCPARHGSLFDPKQPDRHVPPYSHRSEARYVDISPQQGRQPDSGLGGPLGGRQQLLLTETRRRRREWQVELRRDEEGESESEMKRE